MTEEQIALAKRAVVCKGWRWIEGMATLSGSRVTWVNTDMQIDPDSLEIINVEGGTPYEGEHRIKSLNPDFQDPATLGCLLALVREAFPGCHAEPKWEPEWDGFDEAERDHWWAVFTCGPHRLMANGATEAEALVAALEAAP